MDLTNQKKQGQNKITTLNALNAALFSIKICPQEGVIAPDSNQLVISVGDKYAVLGSPKGEYKNYVYNLSKPLCYSDTDYGEFHQEIEVIDNEYVVKAYVEWSNDDGTTIEELEPNDIILFKNNNIVSTNYQNVDIELIYPTYDDFNKYYTNTLTYNSDKKANKSLTMNDLYFKDSFTKTGNEINEEIDNLNVKCITSKNNKFSLDSDGNLTVNSITSNENKNLNITEICNVIYPIGSVYISINDIEPSSLFGGTWEKLEDRFLLASGKTYTNGNIGGEATHKLTINEMPSHTHTLYIDAKGTTIPAWWTRHLFVQNDSPHEAQPNNLTSTGNSQPHNNMPPYLVVNMWKRTA
nr:MAG TPA: baseplate protein [Caudoviricetes sp.]